MEPVFAFTSIIKIGARGEIAIEREVENAQIQLKEIVKRLRNTLHVD